MNKRKELFVIWILLIQTCFGKCPSPNDFPVKPDGWDKYLCGVDYQGAGHPESFFGCTSEEILLEDESHKDSGAGKYFPMGSLIVKAGCTFTGFKNHEYLGEKKVYEGPAVWSDLAAFDLGEVNGFSSYYCDCDMNYITCIPEDSYALVLYCDASSAQFDTSCTYSKTIGTTYSSSIKESMSIDSSIESSMKAEFFKLFQTTLSVSVSTGYDWGSTSESAQSEEVTVTVEAVAPAGYILTIEQAVGKCDESKVKTEMYKITHTDANRVVVKTQIVNARQLTKSFDFKV